MAVLIGGSLTALAVSVMYILVYGGPRGWCRLFVDRRRPTSDRVLWPTLNTRERGEFWIVPIWLAVSVGFATAALIVGITT